MAYLRPNAFERKIFGKIASRFGFGGAVGLAVAGRKSGKVHEVPVLVTEHEGGRYIVSTRGEAEWVRNLRAADGRAELRGKNAGPIVATEVPVAERGPILAAYQEMASGVVKRYFEALPEATDHPVFRIERE